MAVTHATALRTVLADAADNYINTTGSSTAELRLLDSATLIVSFDLQNPAFGAASSGIITLEGTPIAAVAEADGEVDNATITNRTPTASIFCSVSASGMGGDIEVSNVNIANLQDCTLESLTYEAAP